MDVVDSIVNSFDAQRISSNEQTGETIHIRINAHEFNFEDVFQFNIDDLVRTVKQKVIVNIQRELVDGLNHGLYCPPTNEKTGKFLDEERPLRDYPLPGPIATLEFKYKRRIFKSSEMSASTNLKKINSQSNGKTFLDCVIKCDADKISKWLTKGIDPNFNTYGKGETPLTLSASLHHQRAVMLSLVNGGAHLDFRNRDGLTPIHVASQTGNKEALRTLLDLGSSPNYRDAKGWTPLLACTASNIDVHECVEMLLHERAELGTTDTNGWTEVHHACMNDRIQQLEALLFYGADRNAQSTTGDTPLHICAKHNKVECAKILLLRGSDKTLHNIARHTAAHLAALSGNTEMVEIITKFNAATDIVLFNELPQYNQKRRATISKATIRNLKRSRSNMHIERLFSRDAPSSTSVSSTAADQIMKNGYMANGHGPGRFGTGRGDTTLTRPTALQVFSEVPESNGDIPASLRNCCNSETRDIPGSLKNSSNSFDRRYWEEKSIQINRSKKSFGFSLRGSTASEDKSSSIFIPTVEVPARQFIDEIKVGSPSESAGLKANDFILMINGDDVRRLKHQDCINLVQKSGATVTLKICRKRAVPEHPSSGKLSGLDELEKLDKELDESTTNCPEMSEAQSADALQINSTIVDSYQTVTEVIPPYPELFQRDEQATIFQNANNSTRYGEVIYEPESTPESMNISTVSFSPIEFADDVTHSNITLYNESDNTASQPYSTNIETPVQDDDSDIQQQVMMHEDYSDNVGSYVDRNNNSQIENNDCAIDANLKLTHTDDYVEDHHQASQLIVIPVDTESRDASHLYVMDAANPSSEENVYANDEVFSSGFTDMQTPDFAAQAERVRQMYLEKKNSDTLKKESSSSSFSGEISPVNSQPKSHAIEKIPAPVIPKKILQHKVEPVVSDMREIIAQKALERQESNEFKKNKVHNYENVSPVGATKLLKSETVVSSRGKLGAERMIAFGAKVNEPTSVHSKPYTAVHRNVNYSIVDNKMNSVIGIPSSPRDAQLMSRPSVTGQSDASRLWKTSQKPAEAKFGLTSPHKSPIRLPSPGFTNSVKYSNSNSKPESPFKNSKTSIATWVIPPPNQFASVDLDIPKSVRNLEDAEQNAASKLRNVPSRTPSTSVVFRAKPIAGAISVPPSNQFETKKIELWSTADVGDWLASLGYDEYKVKFTERRITGQMLARAGQNELTSYGVLNMLHKIKMDRELKKFKN